MLKFMNMRLMPLFDDDGGSGAGGGDANPGSGDNPSVGAKGDTGSESTIVKFGNIDADLSTPEGRAAAAKAYNNAVKFGETKSQELSEYKKNTPPKVEEPKVEKKPEDNKPSNLDFVAKQLTEDGFDKLINQETQRLKEKYGDKFDLVKDEFTKTMVDGKSKLSMDKKQEFISKGDLENVFKNVYTAKMLEPGDKTPPKVEDLTGKEHQETLPGQPPAGSGVDTTPPPGTPTPEADFDFSKTAQKARTARLAEVNKGLSS